MSRLNHRVRFLLLLAAAANAFAQAPTVADINFYGLRKIQAERILSSLKLRPGDPLPGSKADMEDRVGEVSGIVLTRVEAVCCEGPAAILFIGVEERGAPHAAFRSEPVGDAVLPPEFVEAYTAFLGAVRAAAARGVAAEDLTAGHSLMADPAARAYQFRFIEFAGENLPLLRNVLKNSSLFDQRAIAAAVLGYAADKREVVNDLQYALADPEESVRTNAVRSLVAIAVLGAKQPELGLKISPTWFIELLNSIVLSDRVEAVKALLTLTDQTSPAVLDQIKERALTSLAEMARWKTARYAAPPFLLLGRVAGVTDQEAEATWERGDRESFIDKALGRTK